VPDIPAKCQPIVDQLEAAEQMLQQMENSNADASSIKAQRSKLAGLHAELNKCIHPPRSLPDLVATRVTTTRHPDGNALDATLIVSNEGDGPVSGPFKIAFAVDYVVSYGQDPPLHAYAESVFNVPVSVTIEPGAHYLTESLNGIPIVRRPGSRMPPTFVFYALLDADNEIKEKNERNNTFKLTLTDHRL
jgi:hypothetical protein